MGLPVNRALGITPTFTAFTVLNPTNLGNASDGDWTTVTGTGTETVGAGGATIGTFDFDLGAVYTVFVGGKVGMWTDANVVYLRIMHSLNGIAWVDSNEQEEASTGSGTEIIHYPQVVLLRTRYVRLRFWSGAAQTASVKLYEFQAIELPDVAGIN